MIGLLRDGFEPENRLRKSTKAHGNFGWAIASES
jgi:hypothetical protein